MESNKKKYYEEKYNNEVLVPPPYFIKQFEYIIKSFHSPPTKKIRILDLGGGTGEYSRLLQDAGYNVTLFDFSQEAIEKAHNIGVQKTICADFNTFKFGNEKYDIILAKGFSLLNTDKSLNFERILKRSKLLLNSEGLFIYWGQTNLSNEWTKSGWYQLSNVDLKRYFTHSLILPAFRYQLNLPLFLNLFISKTIRLFNKLPRSISLIGIAK